MTSLPDYPFDGMEFIDAFRVLWRYDSSISCWRRISAVQDIPIATQNQPGLMSPNLKGLMDSIPDKGGGFGIIVKPLLSHRSQSNPDGVLFGDVKLVSESLDLSCVFSDGTKIPSGCKNVNYSPESKEPPPGFDVNFSDLFLKTLCVAVPGGQGPSGIKGEKGETGDAGTGDGPKGETGKAGADATVRHTFTGIKINDVDDIFDTAVVNLELDQDAGKIYTVNGRVKTPDDTTPADQFLASQLSRSVEFTDDNFNFNLVKSSNDSTSLDLNLISYPIQFDISGEIKEVEITKTKLSDYVNNVVGYYKTKFDEISEAYDKQIEEYFKKVDADSRKVLDELSTELAECEFSLPLEYCVGIDPADCHAGDSGVQSALEICALADYIFGEATVSCQMSGLDMGTISIKANEEEYLKWPTGTMGAITLPKGIYIIIYTSGALMDSGMTQKGRVIVDHASRGYFLSSGLPMVGVQMTVLDPDHGLQPPIKLPLSGETYNKYDKQSVENAYVNGPLLERIMAYKFNSDGGEILLQAPTETDRGYGDVSFRIIRCICNSSQGIL